MMIEVPAEIQQKYVKLEKKRFAAEERVAHLLGLLERADKRRRENPKQTGRWNRTLDNLEEGLLHARHALGLAEQETGWLKKEYPELYEFEVNVAEQAAEPATAEGLVEPSEEALSEADMEVAVAHIESAEPDDIDAIGIQDVALAQAYLDLGAEKGAQQNPVASQRVAEYIANAQTSATPQDEIKRRSQHMLRLALDKCSTENIGALTLNEAALVTTAHYIFSRKTSLSPSERRLMSLLNEVCQKIERRLNRISSARATTSRASRKLA